MQGAAEKNGRQKNHPRCVLRIGSAFCFLTRTARHDPSPPYSTVVIPYTGKSWDYFTAAAEVYSEKYQMYLSIGALDFIRYYQYIDHPDSPYSPFQGKTYTRDYPVEPGTYECVIGGGTERNLYYGLFVYVTLIIE